MTVASIQNLTVRYGSFTALHDFTIDIPEGSVGLLGPNGAGKTTLIKTLLGFVKPTEGRANVLGLDFCHKTREIRQLVGFMPEQDCHIPGMTAVQFVAFAGELAGMPPPQAMQRAHEVLEYCGLGEARYRNVETYSTGMLQRIKLAQALVHGPRLLLLDEPTNGLDPNGRRQMLELVRSISHTKGISVVISSHLLPDIERVCDDVIVVVQGHLRTAGNILKLKQLAGHPFDVELREANPNFAFVASQLLAEVLEESGARVRIRASLPVEEMGAFIWEIARRANAQVRAFAPAERTLEEAFLEVIR